VEIRQGKCIDTLQQLQSENTTPFDMVFMDADKPPYTEYFQMAVKLCRPGSIIIADNVVRAGKILDPNSSEAAVQGVLRFNKMLSECRHVHATILQTVGIKEWDGMAIAVVK
jgi:caffeoyl-CoA O-methyltransferase